MPLSVIKYEKITDNLELNFELGEIRNWQIICPNPVVADSFRVNLKNRTEEQVNFETTTIAKFLGDLFETSFGEQKVSRKSELLKILGTVWKIKFEGEDTSFFHQAFELFTDLRSFTLDKSLMETVLENYHPIVSESVKTFWLVLEDQNIIDEHQAYYNLYHQCLENPDILASEDLSGFIFTGFSHLSANQIEFIKLLGKFTDVIVPIPSEIIEGSLSTDWVDWILSQADNVLENEGKNESRVVPTNFFSKGRGNSLLKRLDDETFDNIVFPKKSLGYTDILRSFSKDYFFKTQNTDQNTYVKVLQQELVHEFFNKGHLKVSADEIKGFLLKKIIETKFNGLKEFSLFKVVTSLIDIIDSYAELSDANNDLGEFDFSILWEVLELNLPRNFYLPLLKEKKGTIVSLKELYQLSPDSKSILVVSSDHDLKAGGTTNYSKDVQEILVTLGPIRRKGLDFLFYVYHVKALLGFKETSVLLEEGLLEHDQAWAQVFSGVELETKELGGFAVTCDASPQPKLPPLNYTPPDKLSASRMQAALECPQKYFYSYVLGLGKEPDREKSVDPRVLGEVEHEVVQDYLYENKSWDEGIFSQMVDEKIKENFDSILLDNILLNEEIYSEITAFGRQTIFEFLKLKETDPNIKFSFEKKIDDQEGTGAADVLVDSEVFGRMLFDLKRSSGSIPDKYKILSLKTIQIWYYQYFLKGKEMPFNSFGYINLSDPEASVVFVNDQSLKERLIDLKLFDVKSYESIKEDYDYYLDVFYDKFKDIKELISEDINYPITPTDPSVCKFCPGANICDRGQSNG